MDQLAAYLDARLQPLEQLAQQSGDAELIAQAERVVSDARGLAEGCADGAAFEQRFAQSPLFDTFNGLYTTLFMRSSQAAPVSVKDALAATKEARAQLSAEERDAQRAETREGLFQALCDDVDTDLRLLAKDITVAEQRERHERMREEIPGYRDVESAVNTIGQIGRLGRLFKR